MFAYYLELALRSLKRSPGLTVLMVLAIGFGVAASMTTYSVFRAVSGDPIPWKSAQLFVPQIDNWGPKDRDTDGEPPSAMGYLDATTLMRDHRAKRQSAMYQISPSVVPTQAGKHPLNVTGHAVYSEFFPMLDVPFLYGNGWSAQDDAQRAAVAVISSKLNEKLFGNVDSVGRTVNIEGRDYRVVGVLDHWNPQPRFYDVTNTGGFSENVEDVFLPFERAISVGLPNNGNTNCNATPKESGFVGLQHSECVWIAYMAELDDAAAVTAYRQYLDAYAKNQQKAGRFGWAPNNRLRNLPDYLEQQQVVPRDTKVSLLVALGLLLVCLVNTVGLLLAKFLRRSGEIGVRRALGATRRAVFAQCLVEAGLIGLIGGVGGWLLSLLGLWLVRRQPVEYADLAHLDGAMFVTTFALAVAVSLLAGALPALRASRVAPALQLKTL